MRNTPTSDFAFEETYLSIDLPQHSDGSLESLRRYTDPSGYRFNYHQLWLRDPSKKKLIGLRKLKMIPTRHNLQLRIDVNALDFADDLNSIFKDVGEYLDITFSVVPGDSLESVLSYICSYFNNNVLALMNRELFPVEIKSGDPLRVTYSAPVPFMYFTYNKRTTELKIYVKDVQLNVMQRQDLTFVIRTNSYGDGVGDCLDFAMFLNQDINTLGHAIPPGPDPAHPEVLDEMVYLSTGNVMTFTNVWDRQSLFFHASFSTAQRQIIGENTDYWEIPSKLYVLTSSNNPSFYVWFTTDGQTPIVIRYAQFMLDLSYILNYKKTTVLSN